MVILVSRLSAERALATTNEEEEIMSVSIDHAALHTAERIESADEMYRLGLEASTPGLGTACLVTAHKWFNLAAMAGNEDARAYRQQLTFEMSPREVAKAQREAREWMRARRPAVAVAA